MRNLRLALPIAVALALAGCGQQDQAQGPGATPSTSAIARLDVVQSAPVVGERHWVTVKAYDRNDREVPVDLKTLTWEVKDPSVLRYEAPGQFTPLKPGETTLTVRTPDGRAYTEYPELVWPKGAFKRSSAEEVGVSAQAAPNHSYTELINSWSSYSGKTVDSRGTFCNASTTGAYDCGQCVGFIKAFSNNIPSTQPSTAWHTSGTVLSRGSSPVATGVVSAGDTIGTKEIGSSTAYSLADFNGKGHVALYSSYSSGQLYVRDQNWDVGTGSYKINYHSFRVPVSNGTPYCATTTNDDPGDACNYYRMNPN